MIEDYSSEGRYQTLAMQMLGASLHGLGFWMVLSMAMLALTTCSGNRTVTGPVEEEAVKMSDGSGVPSDFSLEISSGGGFTGIYQGTRVLADGSVIKWKTMPNAGPKTEVAAGTLNAAQMLELVNAVRSSQLLTLHMNQPANMTYSIRVILAGQKNMLQYGFPIGAHPAGIAGVIDTLNALLVTLPVSNKPTR